MRRINGKLPSDLDVSDLVPAIRHRHVAIRILFDLCVFIVTMPLLFFPSICLEWCFRHPDVVARWVLASELHAAIAIAVFLACLRVARWMRAKSQSVYGSLLLLASIVAFIVTASRGGDAKVALVAFASAIAIGDRAIDNLKEDWKKRREREEFETQACDRTERLELEMQPSE